jgi:hypothetical protein
VTTPAIDDLIARALAGGCDRRQGLRRRRRRLPVLLRSPEANGAIRQALAGGGARLLEFTFERHGLTRG